MPCCHFPEPHLAMPSAKGLKTSVKMTSGVAEAMKARQGKYGLSELGVNWIGRGGLNASESDLIYKYHVAHLSEVYGSRSKVNNATPRSMINPPPWANLDPRVLSPIPDKRQREARWNHKFFQGNCLHDQHRFAERSSVSGAGSKSTRRRPASAGVRREAEASATLNTRNTSRRQGRPSSATVRGRDFYTRNGNDIIREGNDTSCVVGAMNKRQHSSIDCNNLNGGVAFQRQSCGRQGGTLSCEGAYSQEEMEIIEGKYRLDGKQESIFREFVAMLVNFDTCAVVNIIDDAFREVQMVSGLENFTGCGDK